MSEKGRKTISVTVSKKQIESFKLMALSLLLGFIGGFIAVKINPGSSIGNNPGSSETTKVVLKEGEIIADISDKVSPSVVSINVKSITKTFNPFFGSGSYESQGAGTGIILSEDGLVITNKHVIPDNVKEVSVVLQDGTIYSNVEVVGRETFNDIAYLQIKDVKNLTPANLGDSDAVRVGQRVVAIGNALGEFQTTVTSGIISGKGRPIVAGVGSDSEQLNNLFQTDTAINPGNSGGPLLNINGEVIGMNTAIAGNAENIGFAIPINDIKPGLKSIQDNGELVRPYLGVRYITLTKDIAKQLETDSDVGALVYADSGNSAILPDSPADKAGLKKNDIIVMVNTTEITTTNPLPNVVSRYQVGDSIELTILRNGKKKKLTVVLEQVPQNL